MNLFFVYIGGRTEKSLIELHDVRFVIGNTIEDTYEDLRKSWWGTPESLHLDCWGMVKSVENYNIKIKATPSESDLRLFFVNLGGYDAAQFTELHKNILVVAENEIEAKAKAVKQVSEWMSPHRDYLHEVENVFSIDESLLEKGFYIHLEPTDRPGSFEFVCAYNPIAIKKIEQEI